MLGVHGIWAGEDLLLWPHQKDCHNLFSFLRRAWDTICLFICLGFCVPLENFSLIWRRHHYWWRTANFDLCMVMRLQWSSPRTRDTHTYCWAFSSGSVTIYSYLFLRLIVSVAVGIRNPYLQLAGERSNRLRHRGGAWGTEDLLKPGTLPERVLILKTKFYLTVCNNRFRHRYLLFRPFAQSNLADPSLPFDPGARNFQLHQPDQEVHYIPNKNIKRESQHLLANNNQCLIIFFLVCLSISKDNE